MKTTKFLSVAAIAVAATVALAGCSTGGSSSGGGSDTAAASCKPSDGKVTLDFTTWVPNMDKVVAIWNKANPDIQVKVSIVANGNSGTYQNFFNQLKAKQAPDIGQVEYDTLPAFRVQGGLEDIGACAGISDAKKDFSDGLWNQVTFGESKSVYAVPQDSGPMALYYRKDLFEKAGLDAPKTWEEYAEDAVKIKKLGGNITNFAKGDVNQFAGLVSQAGGQWFSNSGDQWDVNLTDSASKKVAATAPVAAPRAKLTYKDQRDYELLPKRIEALDAQIASDAAKLAAPNLYMRDNATFARLTAAIEAARAEKEAAELRWLELAEQVGE